MNDALRASAARTDHRKRLASAEADKSPGARFNAISYPDEPGLREPDSLHFFRIFKEQPNQTYCAARAVRWALSFPVSGASGGANRDRTGDLLLAKQALSQLSYGPLKEGRNCTVF